MRRTVSALIVAVAACLLSPLEARASGSSAIGPISQIGGSPDGSLAGFPTTFIVDFNVAQTGWYTVQPGVALSINFNVRPFQTSTLILDYTLDGNVALPSGVFVWGPGILSAFAPSSTQFLVAGPHRITLKITGSLYNSLGFGAFVQWTAAPPPIASIKVAPDQVVLAGGQTQTFTATAFDQNGASLGPVAVSWSSDASQTNEAPEIAFTTATSNAPTVTIRIGQTGGLLAPGIRATAPGGATAAALVVVPYIKSVEFTPGVVTATASTLSPALAPATIAPNLQVIDVVTEHTAIFSDRETPGSSLRNVVQVTAVIGPDPRGGLVDQAIAGTTVFFQSYDPADEDKELANANPEIPGPANNPGVFADQLPASFPVAGSLSSSQATVAVNAATNKFEAAISLTVSLTPGDNYRVVASMAAAGLDKVQAWPNDARNGCRLRLVGTQQAVPGPGVDVPPARGTLRTSPLLTVWRKLHIELDSMEAVDIKQVKKAHQYFEGTIVRIEDIVDDANGRRLPVVVDQKGEDFDKFPDHAKTALRHGVLVVGSQQYPIAGQGIGGAATDPRLGRDVRVFIQPVAGLSPGQSCVVRSSHDLELLPKDKDALLTLLHESFDQQQNVFAETFIQPVFDGGGAPQNNGSDIQFEFNLLDTKEFSVNSHPLERRKEIVKKIVEKHWGSQLLARDPTFLVNYLGMCYQPSRDVDGDDPGPGVLGGETAGHLEGQPLGTTGAGCGVLYLETVQYPFGLFFGQVVPSTLPKTFLFSRVAAHELGHMFGLHEDEDPENPERLTFSIMGHAVLDNPDLRHFKLSDRVQIRAYNPATRITIQEYAH